MDYKYYFIVYSGLLAGSEEEATSMQLGSAEDLEKLQSDAMDSWDGYEGEEGGEDPQIWDRCGESDATCVLGRGNNLEVLAAKFYAAIKEKLGYNFDV
jgi:hypothetical protein